MQHLLVHLILLKKTDLANLKSDLDNIDTNKVKTYQVVLAI